MTEIKRYDVDSDPQAGPASLWDIEDENGKFVYYEDHAAIVAELQEQVRALAAENAQMLRLLTDISENHDEYVNQDEYLYAGVPMDYVSEINSYVSRDVNAQNPFEATDAALLEIRAQAVSNLPKVGDGKEQEAFEAYARSRSLDLSQHPLHYLFLDGKTNQARSAWRECLVYVSSQLAAGEQQ